MKYVLGLIMIFLIFSIPSCEKVGDDVAKISVEFAWDLKKIHISPKLQLKGVPQKTAYFKIKMHDLDANYPHGSIKLNNDGSGVIKAGAIDNYQGPSPPSSPHRYEFTVKAFNKEGVLIGVGTKMREYPEE